MSSSAVLLLSATASLNRLGNRLQIMEKTAREHQEDPQARHGGGLFPRV